ncbi:hypothetical protein IVB30_31980 [Bradyrhizobium sp. 200]|uniref:hypothetical protein n=1 Tax=Bradyrhizobium sp. 200 TaxID=2782665 RepID=UPI001FFE3F8B|nr:hypothetical protein [Bradyrhizobium sp. 200]UPJ47800.1 hypothetical protein IVB30_31980 [Bradyrhizobium sp. 200]
MAVISSASVAMSISLPGTVEDPHHSSAPTTTHHTGEQSADGDCDLPGTVLLHVCVIERTHPA